MFGDILRRDHARVLKERSRHGLLARLVEWDAQYRQSRKFAALSDEQLNDIGLTRTDVAREQDAPFWDPPTQFR